jgi:Family of unknown function (DUF6496)
MARRGLGPKGQRKVKLVMGEYKTRALHSGRSGRLVSSRKQAIAIALSQGRKVSRARRGK